MSAVYGVIYSRDEKNKIKIDVFDIQGVNHCDCREYRAWEGTDGM